MTIKVVEIGSFVLFNQKSPNYSPPPPWLIFLLCSCSIPSPQTYLWCWHQLLSQQDTALHLHDLLQLPGIGESPDKSKVGSLIWSNINGTCIIPVIFSVLEYGKAVKCCYICSFQRWLTLPAKQVNFTCTIFMQTNDWFQQLKCPTGTFQYVITFVRSTKHSQ